MPLVENATLLKGLAWCCYEQNDATLAVSLANAALEGYRKISGVGPRSAKIASACVYALKQLSPQHGAAQLERIRLNVKQMTYRKEVENALNDVALRAQMSREDLEELTVPTFGLEPGPLRFLLGPAIAEIKIVGSKGQIQWSDPDGRSRKDAPAEVKRAYEAELKDLKRCCDDLTRMLTAHSEEMRSMRRWHSPSIEPIRSLGALELGYQLLDVLRCFSRHHRVGEMVKRIAGSVANSFIRISQRFRESWYRLLCLKSACALRTFWSKSPG